MFVDNQFADLLRRWSRKGWFRRNVEAVCLPLFSVVMVLGGISMVRVLHGSFGTVSHGASRQRVPAHQIRRLFLR